LKKQEKEKENSADG